MHQRGEVCVLHLESCRETQDQHLMDADAEMIAIDIFGSNFGEIRVCCCECLALILMPVVFEPFLDQFFFKTLLVKVYSHRNNNTEFLAAASPGGPAFPYFFFRIFPELSDCIYYVTL